MKPRAAKTEKALLALSQDGERTIDERQARLDCAGILERLPGAMASEGAREGKRRSRNPARILAGLAADVYFAHTGKGPGRTVNKKALPNDKVEYRAGGLFLRFVAALADDWNAYVAASVSAGNTAAHLIPVTGSIPNACQEVQRALNASASLQTLRGIEKDDPNSLAAGRAAELPKREEKRTELLKPHVLGYVDDEGNSVVQPEGFHVATVEGDGDILDGDAHEGWPVIGGYEPAPDRSRSASRTFAAALRSSRSRK